MHGVGPSTRSAAAVHADRSSVGDKRQRCRVEFRIRQYYVCVTMVPAWIQNTFRGDIVACGSLSLYEAATHVVFES